MKLKKHTISWASMSRYVIRKERERVEQLANLNPNVQQFENARCSLIDACCELSEIIGD